MWLWVLAFVLLASLAGMGYRQGAIRVAFSFVGILLGALLAGALGRLLKPVLMAVGLKNPVLLWVLGPLLVFVAISIGFKIAALAVHQKVDVYYKYKGGDLRLALWERINRRLGLCVGLLNGTIYFLLLCWAIYPFSYWTVQMASSDNDPKTMQILNRLGRDLHDTGLAKAARALDPLPQSFYDAADIAALIYNNSLLEARLARYPAFLSLAEQSEFQEIANDTQFTEMRLRQEPLMNVLNHPKIQAILLNRDLLQKIWGTLIPNLQDLRTYLTTGKSAKYDQERILGRWNFDVNAALGMVRRGRPNLTATEMLKYKKALVAVFSKMSLVAAPDHQAFMKRAPRVLTLAGAQAGDQQNSQGEWKGADSKYQLSFSGGTPDLAVNIEGDRMAVTGPGGIALAFTRED
jgi:hypothetical protein